VSCRFIIKRVCDIYTIITRLTDVQITVITELCFGRINCTKTERPVYLMRSMNATRPEVVWMFSDDVAKVDGDGVTRCSLLSRSR